MVIFNLESKGRVQFFFGTIHIGTLILNGYYNAYK